MKSGKIIALGLLALLPIAMKAQEAQEIEKLNARIDSLSQETTTLDKIVRKLSKFKVSAYIQGQFQYGQEDATLKVGDKNEHEDKGFNRFGIRRGRLKFEYNDGIGTGAVQIEANDKGVSFRDLYIGIKDPWTKRCQLMAGVFNRPFGHEIGYSTSGLESPERATIIQYFFPDERDLGAMLTLRAKETSPIGFLRLDAGLFAGNSINRETDSRKDFIGRLGAEKKIGNWGKWGLGASYYNGGVYNPTTTAYELQDKKFIAVDKGETGTYMKREYIGLDAQFSFKNSWGTTSLRGEGLLGTQPGIAGSSKSPNTGTRPANEPENSLFKRPFIGYFFYLVHDIGTGAVQIEANDKGVSFRDLYIGIKDPWTKRCQLMAGVFNRPFGHEIGYSTSGLESPERATIIQYFFPDERDLGAMLTLRAKETSPIGFLRLDAGLFAGNSINRETDSRKDFIGRLGAEKKIGNWGKWGLGASYYNGGVYNPTTTAYELQDKKFIAVDKGETGTYMKREYIGLDAQFSFKNSWGTTSLRGEGLLGTQPGIAGSSKSPNTGTRPANEPENSLFKRPFIGYFFYLVHDIGTTPFSAVLKYDVYDPNTKLKGNEIGVENSLTSKTDLAQSTLGIGALYRFNKHIRVQAYYEFNFNEKSDFVKGYEKDREDDVFTLRLQYKF